MNRDTSARPRPFAVLAACTALAVGCAHGIEPGDAAHDARPDAPSFVDTPTLDARPDVLEWPDVADVPAADVRVVPDVRTVDAARDTGPDARPDAVVVDAVRTQCVNLPDVTLWPLTRTVGDMEFNGHGPDVHVSVTFSRTATTVSARACVTMTETVSDWTTGNDCQTLTVSVANSAVLSSNFDLTYTDTDTAIDDAIGEASTITRSDAVLSVTCTGDTSGGDLCSSPMPSCSGCTVQLTCVNVRE